MISNMPAGYVSIFHNAKGPVTCTVTACATGTVEAISCVMALNSNILPPTVNLDNPDPQCDLDFIPHTARKVKDLNTVISNSFGFGGHNICLVFRKL